MKQTVEISRIDPNPLNERSMKPEDIEIIAESIRKDGLFESPVVYPKAGRYVLLSGHRRLAALRMLGVTEAEVRVVPCPSSLAEEQEILAEANIHRSSPEEIRTEVKLAERAWNSMDKDRCAILREAYLKKFREANQGNPAYAEDPDKFITGNFRPVHDYIRQINGLTASNSTIKRYLMEILPEECRPSEGTSRVKPITLRDVRRCAKTFAGMLETYQTDDPELLNTVGDALEMTEKLLERLDKEAA